MAFLEGGYDLRALRDSVAACVGAFAGVDHRPEPATTGGRATMWSRRSPGSVP